MDNDTHPLDQWDKDAAKSAEDFQRKCLKDASLVYSVFCTPQGEQLLGKWTEELVMQPEIGFKQDGSTSGLLEIGLIGGSKNFIRSILYAVKTHEEN